ncbi:VOC family protein [Brevundimonas sp.]
MNQITVGTTDFSASVVFYETLGFRLIVSSREAYARFELPDGEATFSIHLQDVVPSDGPVIYFEVDDVDATVQRFKANGVAFDTVAQDQTWLWREVHFSDPSGNRLCIFHAGQNRRYPPWRMQGS